MQTITGKNNGQFSEWKSEAMDGIGIMECGIIFKKVRRGERINKISSVFKCT
jgi:hypothetical protein